MVAELCETTGANPEILWQPPSGLPRVARGIARAFGLVLFDSPISFIGSWIASSVAAAYARFFPNVTCARRGKLQVCSGLPVWAYPRGGVCVGSVFLTGPQPSESVLKHELKHANQWRRYGLVFPVLYLAAGRDPFHNRFEIEANLIDGGYVRR